MAGAGREDGGGRRLVGAAAHQAGVGARAGGQTQRIEDDRLAGAGLAGERGQARPERQVEALDQDDIADAEANQHGRRMTAELALA